MAGEDQDPSPFGTSLTMEEIEASLAEDKSQEDATKGDTKLAGDSVPVDYRGKTIDEVLQDNQRLQDSLRLRDAETLTYKSALETRASAAPAATVEQPKELTREELAAIYADDPLKAIEVMQDQAIRRAEGHLAVRLGSLEAGTIGAAEAQARAKYPEEFELFGDDLIKFKNQMPNQAIFATLKGWEDMVSYIRGQDGNIEKIIAKRSGRLKTPVEARREQRSTAGFSRSSSRQTDVGDASSEATAEQKMVAEGLGMDIKEYLKWDRVGR